MSRPHVLAIDQGTTGTKIHRLFLDGKFETVARSEHRQILPRPGWVEHDPEELLRHVCLAQESDARPLAIGIANQGETVVAWDAETGRPIHNAIVWQDSRSSDFTDRLKAEDAEELTRSVAGLPLDPYFSASKLRWLLDHVPEAKDLLRQRRLRLGTSDAFFVHRLTGVCSTDVTTASRTSLMSLESRTWDHRLCRLFGVPEECLPEIKPSAGFFGAWNDIPVTASITDQQAALFGHGCRETGQAKITFGTGAFALCLVGARPVLEPQSGLASTIAWQLPGEDCQYALEGGTYNAAAAVNWARSLSLFKDFSEIDKFDGESALSRHLVFVPALSGLACPHWDRRAAGLWLGMGLETTRNDLMQSLLEGVALLGTDVLDAMSRVAPASGPLSVDGGMTANTYFMQFLANATGRTVIVPGSEELTGYGTALLSLIGSGLIGQKDLPSPLAPKATIEPTRPLSKGDRDIFAEAVRRSRHWR